MSKLIKWEEFNPTPVLGVVRNPIDVVRKPVDIACPVCGHRIYKRLAIILTSNPPKYQYECDDCGWVGFNY